MVNIVLAPSIAKDHLMIHMLSTMHFFLVPGPVPDTGTAHILDMVLSRNQVGYHSQDRHIPHHPHPLARRLFLDSRDRMALMVVILEELTCLSREHLSLMVLRCRLVQLIVIPQYP